MKTKLFLMTVVSALLLALSACQPGSTEPAAPGDIVDEAEEAAAEALPAARQMLANELGVTDEELELVKIEERTWQDSCLGLGGPAESCLREEIEGYLITLQVGGESYEVRTDLSGESVRVDLPGEEATADPVETARQVLAQQINALPETLELTNVEDREWPNACLGLPEEGEMCAEVLTPGKLVTFELDGERYNVRTDEDARFVRVEAALMEEMPAPVEEARLWMAQELGVDPASAEIRSYEQQEWSDSCLGLGGAAESCASVITPGFMVVVAADGRVFEVRTDMEGETFRYLETADPSTEYPAAAVLAREHLAEALGVGPETVEIASVAQQEWPNGCLGLAEKGEMCTQAITPGWVVMLNVNGERYEVRTNMQGSSIRIAGEVDNAGSDGAEDAVVFYRRSGGIGGDVTEYFIFEDRIEARSSEEGPDQPVSMTPVAPEAVEELVATMNEMGAAELAGNYVPEETCCDRFHYEIAFYSEGERFVIEALDGAEDVPDAVWEIIGEIEQFVADNMQ